MGDTTGIGAPGAIGRYRIVSVLGRGAMGVIYQAHDPVIDRTVAIKLVRADLLDGEDRADYIRRFQQEAQAAGRCTHPNIVGIYDFALHEGNPYLAMEFIDGVALNQVVSRAGRFGVPEIVDLAGQMLDGLGAAHALGVVHRDIKPANVMLTQRGRVKVTDFGISRIDTSHITGAGAVVGTPSYMSPEQCRGEQVDARSDLFSVAVVLYELVTGSKPFAGTSQQQVWHRLLNEEPAPSEALRPEAPAALHAAIRRGLAKTAGARFPDAEAMAAAVRDAGGVRDALASTATELDRTVMAARPVAGEPNGEGPEAGVQLDSTTMSSIERNLAQHVGPIAHYLLKSAVRRADTMEALCRTLADNIPNGAARQSFSRDLEVQLGRSTTTAGLRTGGGSGGAGSRGGGGMAAALTEAELAAVQAALTRYVGPVARVLVKRAVPGCSDLTMLRQRVAQHIEGAADRAAFLKAN